MATRKSVTSEGPLAAGAQTIEQLQQRYEQLNKQKIQSETKLESAKQQLELLQREAREKYGTDDLQLLRQKLQAMKDENERKRADYQKDLDRIESDLARVEQDFLSLDESAAKGVQ